MVCDKLLSLVPTEEVVPDWSDPALYIELFVNRRHHLTQFLEHQIIVHVCHCCSVCACICICLVTSMCVCVCACVCAQPHGNLRDVIFTTLLELYLAEIGTCRAAEDRHSKEKRALELMQRKNATYDIDHALGNSLATYHNIELVTLPLSLSPFLSPSTLPPSHPVLAQMHDFKAGILFLYEKAGL